MSQVQKLTIPLNSDIPPITMLQATSLKEETGQAVDRIAITQRFLERFEQYYVAFLTDGFPSVLPQWRAYSAMIGQRVKNRNTVQDDSW